MSERESDAWFALERAVREMAMELPPSDLASTRAIQHVTRFIERRETHLHEVNAALVEALRDALNHMTLGYCAEDALLERINAALARATTQEQAP